MPPAPDIQRQKREPMGPTIGVFVILLVMIAASVYFWYERAQVPVSAIPLIPGDTSTTSVQY